jgi:hypothetical protein
VDQAASAGQVDLVDLVETTMMMRMIREALRT